MEIFTDEALALTAIACCEDHRVRHFRDTMEEGYGKEHWAWGIADVLVRRALSGETIEPHMLAHAFADRGEVIGMVMTVIANSTVEQRHAAIDRILA